MVDCQYLYIDSICDELGNKTEAKTYGDGDKIIVDNSAPTVTDEEVVKILRKKYKLDVVFDNWSNGKTVQLPLIRESVGLGNQSIANDISNGNNTYTIHSEGVSTYDALFTSDLVRAIDSANLAWPEYEKIQDQRLREKAIETGIADVISKAIGSKSKGSNFLTTARYS